MRRKLHKVVRWLLLLVGAACAALILGTVVPRPLLDQAVSSEAPARRILVLASPIHTDIAVPDRCDHARRILVPARRRLAGRRSERPLDAVRLGQPRLSTWRRRNCPTPAVGPLFKALTLDASVMHVEILGAIDETHAAVSGFTFRRPASSACSPSSAQALPRPNGAPVHIEGAHYGDADGFFEANGSFNALIGCNTWTARGAAPGRAADRLVEPAAGNARLLAGAA